VIPGLTTWCLLLMRVKISSFTHRVDKRPHVKLMVSFNEQYDEPAKTAILDIYGKTAANKNPPPHTKLELQRIVLDGQGVPFHNWRFLALSISTQHAIIGINVARRCDDNRQLIAKVNCQQGMNPGLTWLTNNMVY